jgi:hypothetical protein
MGLSLLLERDELNALRASSQRGRVTPDNQ